MEQKRQQTRFLIAWCIVMAVGAVLFFFRITRESLWYDESYTGALVRQPIFNIIDVTGGDNHPPLYYIMLRVFVLIFGNSVLSLRAFSAIGALALAALGIGPVRRAMGDRTGFLYTVLALFLPITVSMAQEARMYTWAAFFVTGSALYGYLGFDEGKAKDWIGFGLFTLCAAYTHYYALLAVGMVGALLLVLILIKKKKAAPFLLTAAAVAVLYLPWVFVLAGAVSRVKSRYWIPPVTGDVVMNVLVYPFSNKFSTPIHPFLPFFSFITSAIILLYGILTPIGRRDKGVTSAGIATVAYILTLAAGIAASWIIRPVLVDRYMVPVLGLFVLGVSYGMARLGSKLTGSILALVFILLVSDVQISHTLSNRFNGPMLEAVETLDVEPGDIFLHTDEHTLGTFCYYYPDHMNYYYIRDGAGGYSNYDAFRPNGMVIDSLDQIDKEPRIWLVERFGGTDTVSAAVWMGSGQLKKSGTPTIFRLPLSWYSFRIYPVHFPDNNTDVAEVQQYGSLTVRMSGFNSDTGKAIVCLYNGGYMDKAPYQYQAVSISNGEAEAVFENLLFDEYAIICFHDTNGNHALDMTGSIPNEGLGYSNFTRAPDSPPEFDKCSFIFNENNSSVNIPVFYIK